ncbi:MAG: hypothetical protein Q7S64_03200 [bacterium]|nr:hypothetical protein [bacterium]
MSPSVLCVFGRGIEKVEGVWEPTQAIEQLSEQGGHPGERIPGIECNSDDGRVVIAGGEYNVRAAVWLHDQGQPPAVLVFAAGRPNYLLSDPDPTLSEGKIMLGRFTQQVVLSDSTRVVIQDQNKNTRDDLVQTLFLARDNKLHNVTIVSVTVHLPRCREFLQSALAAEPSLACCRVEFVASEMVLMHYEPKLCATLQELLISKAYCRTAERERKGIEDLRGGRYNFGSQGYGFARTGP